MTTVFLNDLPYRDGQEDPGGSLRSTIAFSVDDWSESRAMAWVYGIVLGWDEDSLAELRPRFGWDEATTGRLRRLHEAFDRTFPEPASQSTS